MKFKTEALLHSRLFLFVFSVAVTLIAYPVMAESLAGDNEMEWGMMAMTMNFSVDGDIDFNSLQPNTELHMQIKMGDDGLYEIIGTHIMGMSEPQNETQSAIVSGVVNSIDSEKSEIFNQVIL